MITLQDFAGNSFNCVITTHQCFWNNAPDSYVGRVKYYDGDMYLYSESTGIHRVLKDDALDDAIALAKESLALNLFP